MKKITAVVLFALFLSCNNQPHSKLVEGTWKLYRPGDNKDVKLIFQKGFLIFDADVYKDSVQYKFGNNDTTIITTDKNGHEEKISILKISANELVMTSTSTHDTLFLKKEHLDR